MAKSTKSAKSDRQKVIDGLKKQQRGAERRSNFLIVGVCVLIAVTLIGLAAYRPIKNWWDLREFNKIDLASIGAPASACQDVVKKPAGEDGQHVESGSPINYTEAPPAFGPHYNDENSPAPIDRRFYSEDDRPALGSLVHNLEHGYTILWYDDTLDSDEITVLRGLAKKFDGSDTNFRLKFIVAPWLESDESGAKFPEGQHVAMTHWVGGGDRTPEGIWQYCSAPSGEALKDFMKKYPYTDSPEAGAA